MMLSLKVTLIDHSDDGALSEVPLTDQQIAERGITAQEVEEHVVALFDGGTVHDARYRLNVITADFIK